MHLRGNGLEAFGSMVKSIHGINICQQSLCRTNVASGFVSADMLFPSLHRHSVSCLVPAIFGDADDPPRSLPDKGLLECNEPCMRPSEPHRSPEALRTPHGYGCLQVPRGVHDRQCQRVCAHYQKCAIQSRQVSQVTNSAIVVGTLHKHPTVTVVEFVWKHIPHHNFDLDGPGSRIDQL